MIRSNFLISKLLLAIKAYISIFNLIDRLSLYEIKSFHLFPSKSIGLAHKRNSTSIEWNVD